MSAARRWPFALLVGALGLAFAAAVLASSDQRASAQSPAACLGQPPGAAVPEQPGPALRFGISPGAVAGQVGAPASAKPESMDATLAALRQLRPAGTPLVLRLTRFFWADGEAGIEHFLALSKAYTDAGFDVELQLRYQPPSGHDGDIPGWVAFVREVVRRFGPNPHVVGLQVTNEVNFNVSPDSSDGAYSGARDALIQGVIGAHQEVARLGYRQLKIGFNWFYRSDPSSDQSFWTYLGQNGGQAFAHAVDWAGLDIYPGTFFPPQDTPGGERDAIVNALSALRACYMPLAGLGQGVPIYVEENGYPTGPGRSEQMQQSVMATMVGAFNDLRGTYDVSDYRWFNLRDADTSSPNFQQHFGLLHDDYSPKPAFGDYRALVQRLSIRSGASPIAPAPPRTRPGPHPRPRRARLRLLLRGRHGPRGCLAARVAASLSGAPSGRVVRVSYRVRGRLAGRARRRPYRRLLPARLFRRGRSYVVRAVVQRRGAAPLRLSARLRICT